MKHLVGVWGAGHAEVAGAVVALMQCSRLIALSQFCESTSFLLQVFQQQNLIWICMKLFIILAEINVHTFIANINVIDKYKIILVIV